MNRLLLIPCVVSCAGFLFLAGAGVSPDPVPGYHATNVSTDRSSDSDSHPFLSAQEIQNGLIAKWQLYNTQKYAFSRVYRPEQHNMRPGIWVNDALPTPEGSYVGVFVLEQVSQLSGLVTDRPNGPEGESVDSKKEFPIVMDRRTGDAVIFSSGKWTEFSNWAVNGE